MVQKVIFVGFMGLFPPGMIQSVCNVLLSVFMLVVLLRPTTPGGGGSYIEMGDIIRDFETYYLYFHGLGIGGHGSYSIGVASAPRSASPKPTPPATA